MSQLNPGIHEVRTYIARCANCGKSTSPQYHERESQFVIPNGWEKLKILHSYAYYERYEYNLFCDGCVPEAKSDGYVAI